MRRRLYPRAVQGAASRPDPRRPYTFTDDVAAHYAGDEENERRTAEEVLLTAIETLADDKLTGFTLRLALTGHTPIPREGEIDFLAEAEAVFAPSQTAKAARPKREHLRKRVESGCDAVV